MAQQISITRLGQRVRIAGGAELAGADADHHTPTLQRLYRTLNDWFPGGAQLSSGLQVWRGARTMLPDAAPVVGPSGVPGLWLNTGHGAGGWALACGSARAVADLIGQRSPEIGLEEFGVLEPPPERGTRQTLREALGTGIERARGNAPRPQKNGAKAPFQRPRAGYYLAVGITNSAPLGVLSGQRCMMLFCLV
jgi:hypothetical protein